MIRQYKKLYYFSLNKLKNKKGSKMNVSYKIRADELNTEFIDKILKKFHGKNIEIKINEVDETDYLNSSFLNKSLIQERMKNIENSENLITFSTEEFEEMK